MPVERTSPARADAPPPHAGPGKGDFDAWLSRVDQRADPFMAWLGVLFALLVGFQMVARVRPPMGRALDVAGWLIWAVFVVDFLVKLGLAPGKGRFLRRHCFNCSGCCCPPCDCSASCGCCGSAGRCRPRES